MEERERGPLLNWIILDNLKKFVTYSIEVRAFTTEGYGPGNNMTAITGQDGMYLACNTWFWFWFWLFYGGDYRIETEAYNPQAAQAQDVNKLFNSDTVTPHTIYRDCMGNLPLC